MAELLPNEKRSLVDRLFEAQVASCSCQTKTPEIRYHDPMCHYRLFAEAWDALNKACEAFSIGTAARTPTVLLANIENSKRRSDCLSAIEREFFTRPCEDEHGEEGEECLLNWAAEPAEYVKQFREALAALKVSK